MSSPNQNLYLKVSATDMAQGDAPKYYYAKNEDCAEQTSCYDKGETSVAVEQNYHDVLKVTVVDGDTGVNYTCTGTIKVTSDDLSSIALVPSDITIGLKNLDGNDSTATIDANIVKTEGSGATQNLNFKFNGNGEKKVSAYVLLTNTTNPQNYLADKNITFTITAENVNCSIDAAAD